jgi:hypothetical protein
LRNHIIFIREGFRIEFEDFFNSLLSSIRADWNLFTVEDILVKETRKFNETVTKSLEKIIEVGQIVYPH